MINKFSAAVFGAILVGGTVLITSSQVAMAAHDGRQTASFRDFRNQNAGLDRHVARRMFNADRRIDRVVNVNSLPTVSNVRGDRNGVDRHTARLERHTARFNLDTVRQSLQATDSGRFVRLSSGVDLDLTSDARNIVLGNNLFSDSVGSIQISTGGETKTLTAGSRVTAAEYVAAKQVLSGAGQTVSINRSGEATGGNVDLGALTQDNDLMRASNLVVASNVTTTGDFGRHSDFRLLGDLTNYGTVNALSSDSRVRGGTLHAVDINNRSGALINSSVDLTLDASGDLNNDGTIVSTQALNLVAGGSINNSGSIRANGNANLQAAVINNSGVVRSVSGDVNLDGPATASLTVNNANGVISAGNGAINLRGTAYNGTGNSTVTGGDLLSRDLNLNSRQGLTTVDVGQLTGTISETGAAAHVSANTDVLSIGKVCLTGDPTFYNQGDINITANLSVAENLTIVAAGNITSADNVTIQAGDTNKGYNISLIAGAAFTPSGGDNSPTLPGGTAGGVSLSGKSSKTGGGIMLGNNTFVLAQSTDIIGADSGGDILLVAFAGNTPLSGRVLVAPTAFKTGGVNGGGNGNLTIIAGAKGGTVIDTGVLDTTGGSGAAGVINITTAAPESLIRNQPIVYDITGALTNSALVPSSKTNNTSVIHIVDGVGVDIKSSGAINMRAGSISIDGQIQAVTAKVLLLTSDSISGGSNNSVKAMTVDLEASGDIGSSLSKVVVDAPNLTLNGLSTSRGVNTFVGLNGAITSTTVDATFLKGQLVLDAPNVQVTLKAQSLSNYDLTVNTILSTLGITRPVNLFKLTTTNAAFDLNSFVLGNVKSAVINTAGNCGTTGKSCVFDDVGNVSVTSGKGALFATTDKKGAITVSAVNDVVIATEGGVLTGATSTNGLVAVVAQSNTLKVAGNVVTSTGAAFQNKGVKSSNKIAIAAGVQISGDNVVIKVGPDSAVVAPNPANVLLQPSGGGTIQITGSGLSAKAPSNTITATGAGHDVIINNGFPKNSNITLGGGVTITAN